MSNKTTENIKNDIKQEQALLMDFNYENMKIALNDTAEHHKKLNRYLENSENSSLSDKQMENEILAQYQEVNRNFSEFMMKLQKFNDYEPEED